MKSVFLTILMFIVVFTALHYNILNLIDNGVFPYIAFGSFIIVIICAIYFVGLPQIKFPSQTDTPQHKEEKNEK